MAFLQNQRWLLLLLQLHDCYANITLSDSDWDNDDNRGFEQVCNASDIRPSYCGEEEHLNILSIPFPHCHLCNVQDSEGRLLSIYSKFDVINLAAEKTYDDLEVLNFLFLKFRNIKTKKWTVHQVTLFKEHNDVEIK